MSLLQAGSIDYEVDVTIADAVLDNIERAGKRRLKGEEREGLRQLTFFWAERRAMARPVLAHVRNILNALIGHATRGKTDKFLALISTIASLSEDTHPSEAFVHDAILSELKISFESAWRESIQSGQIDLSFVRQQ